MKNRKKYVSFTGKYTLLFLVMAGGMLLPMLLGRRTLIWADDAKSQYYLQLQYMGRLLRAFFTDLFHGHFSVRMYDFANGMGDDINTLVRFHPLDFLSVFVPEAYTKYLYDFLILLRIYLAGLSFGLFGFYMKKKEMAVLIGSAVYISCGYVLKLVIYHPTFGSAMMMFPLLLVGAEEVMRRRRCSLFSFFVFLSFTANYYFTYMALIGTALYVVLRLPAVLGGEGKTAADYIKGFFLLLGRFLVYILTGAAMAALTLLPIVSRLSASPRLSNNINLGSLWVYPLYRYGSWLLGFVSPYMDIGSITKLNFSALVLPALVLLFLRRERKDRLLKSALVLELVLLLLPVFGFIMSGFSNVNNRWTYIIAFTVSFACTVICGSWEHPGKKETAALLAVGLVLLLLSAGGTVFASGNARLAGYRKFIWIGTAEYLCAAGFLLLLKKRGVSTRNMPVLLLGTAALSGIINGFVTYHPALGNTAGEFMKSASVPAYYDKSAMRLLAGTGTEGDFARADTDLISSGTQNISLYYDYQGIAVYNSVLNADLIAQQLELENTGQNGIIRMNSLDGRAALENLAGVQTYLTRAKRTGNIPYGFVRDESLSADTLSVCRNTHPLSFGYACDCIILPEDYEQLTALEKQQVLLEAAMLDPETLPAEAAALLAEGKLGRVTAPSDRVESIQLELPEKETKRMTTVEGGYKVLKRGARLKLSYERRAGCECYVHFIGLRYQGPAMESNHADILVKNMSGSRKLFTVRGDSEAYYLPREDYLVCLGYSEEDAAYQLTVRFRKKGTYSIEGIEICYVPMEGFGEKIDARNCGALQQTARGINSISGTVSAETYETVVFSIPYSPGWSARVDGKPAALAKVNTAYMGLIVEPGEHTIELSYVSPGLRPALVLAPGGWLVFLAFILLERKSRRARMAREERADEGVAEKTRERAGEQDGL